MDLNASDRESRLTSQEPELKSPINGSSDGKMSTKKKAFLATIVLLIVTVIIVIIAVASGGKSGDSPSPDPGPPPPPVGPNYRYNPYKFDGSSIRQTDYYFKGVLEFNSQEMMGEVKDRALKEQLLQNQVGTSQKFRVASENIPMGLNNQNIQKVRFQFAQSAVGRSFLSLSDDSDPARWDIPEDVIPKDKPDNFTILQSMSNFEHGDDKFWFRLGQRYANSSEVLIDTEDQAFVMQHKFMQIDMKLPTQKIYGFGERQREFGLGEGAYTMWANGQETPYDDGTGGKQVYGVHPFCLVKAKTASKFFGIFFRNSNAQAAIITHNSTDQSAHLSYITTGGNIQIVFFLLGDAKEVISRYHNFIGLPSLPPMWSLGWHASAYAYSTLAEVEGNLVRYIQDEIPIEGVWLDIKYMDNYVDFSYDKVNFGGLPEFIKKYREQNKVNFIPIIDAGISADYDTGSSDPDVMALNKYYKMAKESNSLILNISGQPLLAQVWPKNTAFLDWWDKGSDDVWTTGLQDLEQAINGYDGIWLDMNEATIFCNGSHPLCFDPNNPGGKQRSPEAFVNHKERKVLSKEDGVQFLKNMSMGSKVEENDKDSELWYTSYSNQEENSTYHLPFIPMKQNLDNMSMALNATHPSNGYWQYDTHSLFGHMEAMLTKKIIDRGNITHLNGKRTFLLSRSTFAGSGKYTQHWLGDNHRTWADMKYSIAGVMNMNMFAIPMVGPDVCGFFATLNYTEDQNKEICGRWMQLSTFYPFARQHRDKKQGGGAPNEPYNLGDFKDMAISAIRSRYHYIKFIYTCLFEASQYGKTCYDPLLFHYPELEGVYEDTEHTFLVGDAIKVSPVLQPWSELESYAGPDPPDTPPPYFSSFFPKGRWVNLNNYTQVVAMEDPQGEYVYLSPNNESVIHHLRPGYLIPKQFPDGYSQMNADNLTHIGTEILINRDEDHFAQGTVLNDLGLYTLAMESKLYSYYKFTTTNHSIRKEAINQDENQFGNETINQFVFLDDPEMAKTDVACIQYNDGSIEQLNISHHPGNFTTLRKDYVTEGKGHSAGPGIDAHSMRNIFFGYTGDVYSDIFQLCRKDGPHWPANRYWISNKPNLTSPSIELKMEGNQPNLKMNITMYMNGIIRLNWTYFDDDAGSRFEVPNEVASADNLAWCADCTLENVVTYRDYSLEDSPLLNVSDPHTGKVVFTLYDTSMNSVTYINGSVYTQPAPSSQTEATYHGIVGLTTSPSGTYLDDGIYSLYTNRETTSTHPFFMYRAPFDAADANETYAWRGVYSNNQYPQEWVIYNDKERGQVNFSMTATGGVGDLFLFVGNTSGDGTTDLNTTRQISGPSKVMRDFHSVIGTPSQIPKWALGWHIGQKQFYSANELADYVHKYEDSHFAFESLWVGDEINEQFKMFTLDGRSFGSLPDIAETLLRNRNKKLVPQFGAGIAKLDGGDYTPYNSGLASKLFMTAYKDNEEPLVGFDRVQVVYPNFFNNNNATLDWWVNLFDQYHKTLKFDGVSLTQNDPHTKCDGTCFISQRSAAPLQHQLVFTPNGANLETMRPALDAYLGNNVSYHDVYNIYGTMEAAATKAYFDRQNKKSLISIEYGSAGAGKYGHKWWAAEDLSYKSMGQAVKNIMMYNMMGIPLSGSRICGRQSKKEPRLADADNICMRWYNLGALSPFSRLYNSHGSYRSDPMEFKVATEYNMKSVIKMKYHLVPYFYTELKLISQFGGALFQPLYFEFPTDEKAFLDQENNIMLGPALKASILTTKSDGEHLFYFPQGHPSYKTTWCSMILIQNTSRCFEGGNSIPMPQDTYDSFDIALRGGYIVPLVSLDERETKQDIFTTVNVQRKPISLYINPQCNITHGNETVRDCKAIGQYWNDADDLIESSNKTHANFTLEFMSGSYYLFWDIDWENANGTDTMSDTLGQVVIYNIAMNEMAHANWTLKVCDHDYNCQDHEGAVELKAESDMVKIENRKQEIGYDLDLTKYQFLQMTPQTTQAA